MNERPFQRRGLTRQMTYLKNKKLCARRNITILNVIQIVKLKKVLPQSCPKASLICSIIFRHLYVVLFFI